MSTAAEQLEALKEAAINLVAMIDDLQEGLLANAEDDAASHCGRSVLSVAFPAPVPVSVTDSSPRQRRKQAAVSVSVEQQSSSVGNDQGDTESLVTRHQTRGSVRQAAALAGDTGSTSSTGHSDVKSTVSVSYGRTEASSSSWTDTASRSSRVQRH